MIPKPHPREEKGKAKMRGNPLLKKVLRARRSCISVASGCIESCQSQDACWPHAGDPHPFRQELLYC